jgi:cytochrome c551/c552
MGQSSVATQSIIAGNTRPRVSLKLVNDPNQLHWGDEVRYTLDASDAEDGSIANGGIAPDSVTVTAKFESEGDIVATATTQGLDPSLPGSAMIASSTCFSCHQVDAQSVGPAYKLVAQKYENDPGARERLANKVIQGGVGVWGHTPMPGQIQHTLDQAREMVTAVLSANKPHSNVVQGKGGTLRLPQQPKTQEQATGHFVIQASYRDRGAANAASLTAESAPVIIKPKFIQQIVEEGTLSYLDVEVRGDGLKVTPDTGAGIGYYTNPKATLHWSASFPEPGEYQVFLTQSVPAPNDGSTYTISVAGQEIPGTIIPSPGWTSYVEAKVGTLKVTKAGIQEVVFAPNVMKGTIVANVQSIRFKRIRPL